MHVLVSDVVDKMMSHMSTAASWLDRHFANEAAFELARMIIPAVRKLCPNVDASLVQPVVVRLPLVKVSEFHRIRLVAFRPFCLHSPDKTRPIFRPFSSRIGPLTGCPQTSPIPRDGTFAFSLPLTCNQCTQATYTSHRLCRPLLGPTTKYAYSTPILSQKLKYAHNCNNIGNNQ